MLVGRDTLGFLGLGVDVFYMYKKHLEKRTYKKYMIV